MTGRRDQHRQLEEHCKHWQELCRKGRKELCRKELRRMRQVQLDKRAQE